MVEKLVYTAKLKKANNVEMLEYEGTIQMIYKHYT